MKKLLVFILFISSLCLAKENLQTCKPNPNPITELLEGLDPKFSEQIITNPYGVYQVGNLFIRKTRDGEDLLTYVEFQKAYKKALENEERLKARMEYIDGLTKSSSPFPEIVSLWRLLQNDAANMHYTLRDRDQDFSQLQILLKVAQEMHENALENIKSFTITAVFDPLKKTTSPPETFEVHTKVEKFKLFDKEFEGVVIPGYIRFGDHTIIPYKIKEGYVLEKQTYAQIVTPLVEAFNYLNEILLGENPEKPKGPLPILIPKLGFKYPGQTQDDFLTLSNIGRSMLKLDPRPQFSAHSALIAITETLRQLGIEVKKQEVLCTQENCKTKSGQLLPKFQSIEILNIRNSPENASPKNQKIFLIGEKPEDVLRSLDPDSSKTIPPKKPLEVISLLTKIFGTLDGLLERIEKANIPGGFGLDPSTTKREAISALELEGLYQSLEELGAPQEIITKAKQLENAKYALAKELLTQIESEINAWFRSSVIGLAILGSASTAGVLGFSSIPEIAGSQLLNSLITLEGFSITKATYHALIDYQKNGRLTEKNLKELVSEMLGGLRETPEMAFFATGGKLLSKIVDVKVFQSMLKQILVEEKLAPVAAGIRAALEESSSIYFNVLMVKGMQVATQNIEALSQGLALDPNDEDLQTMRIKAIADLFFNGVLLTHGATKFIPGIQKQVLLAQAKEKLSKGDLPALTGAEEKALSEYLKIKYWGYKDDSELRLLIRYLKLESSLPISEWTTSLKSGDPLKTAQALEELAALKQADPKYFELLLKKYPELNQAYEKAKESFLAQGRRTSYRIQSAHYGDPADAAKDTSATKAGPIDCLVRQNNQRKIKPAQIFPYKGDMPDVVNFPELKGNDPNRERTLQFVRQGQGAILLPGLEFFSGEFSTCRAALLWERSTGKRALLHLPAESHPTAQQLAIINTFDPKTTEVVLFGNQSSGTLLTSLINQNVDSHFKSVRTIQVPERGRWNLAFRSQENQIVYENTDSHHVLTIDGVFDNAKVRLEAIERIGGQLPSLGEKEKAAAVSALYLKMINVEDNEGAPIDGDQPATVRIAAAELLFDLANKDPSLKPQIVSLFKAFTSLEDYSPATHGSSRGIRAYCLEKLALLAPNDPEVITSLEKFASAKDSDLKITALRLLNNEGSINNERNITRENMAKLFRRNFRDLDEPVVLAIPKTPPVPTLTELGALLERAEKIHEVGIKIREKMIAEKQQKGRTTVLEAKSGLEVHIDILTRFLKRKQTDPKNEEALSPTFIQDLDEKVQNLEDYVKENPEPDPIAERNQRIHEARQNTVRFFKIRRIKPEDPIDYPARTAWFRFVFGRRLVSDMSDSVKTQSGALKATLGVTDLDQKRTLLLGGDFSPEEVEIMLAIGLAGK